VGLANRFREAMSLPPAASAIVSVRVDGASERLDRARIRGAVRDGALRLSFHAYNTEDDVDRAVSALRG
jgi:selenocysteine lyase/cysteine desulfurase